MNDKFDRIIIGAGAAGLFAAASSDYCNGLIIDHSHMPGLKLLLSGNGQCNITHSGSIKDFLSCYGDKGSKIRSLLYGANNISLINFIENDLNIPLFTRSDGKVFPKSLKASEVLNGLLKKAKNNGFSLNLDENVLDIRPADSGYEVITDKDIYYTEILIISSGGKSYPKTGSDGSMHSILDRIGITLTDTSPALCPIYTHNYGYKAASGISFTNAQVMLYDKSGETVSNTGDILLTHKGFSGPCIINISRHAKPSMKMAINYCYPATDIVIEKKIKSTYQNENKKISIYISKLVKLPLNFIESLLLELGIDNNKKASALLGEEMASIAKGLCCHEYDISGVGSYKEAMVTKGGISLNDINLKTMESVKHKGMYFAGEIVDVDGDTGGYNLQFAYSSAVAAIRAIALTKV